MTDVIDLASMVEPDAPPAGSVTLRFGSIERTIPTVVPPSLAATAGELAFAQKHGDEAAANSAMVRIMASVVRLVGDEFADEVGDSLLLIRGVLLALGLTGKA